MQTVKPGPFQISRGELGYNYFYVLDRRKFALL